MTLLKGQGEVAIMQGVTNHEIRVRCHQQVFKRHPGITVVATPIDQDSITIVEEQALATMESHPQLHGWVVSDAGGGIGIGLAIQSLNKIDEVKVVALEDLPEQLEQIQSALVDSTVATKPHAQGYWAVVNLWQHHWVHQRSNESTPASVHTLVAQAREAVLISKSVSR